MQTFEDNITAAEETYEEPEIICMNCGAKTLYIRSSCSLCEKEILP